MSDEEASIQVGKFFPEIGDKLLNTLQLKKLSREENSLLEASIAQKTNAFWAKFYQDKNLQVPEGEPGCNPNGLASSEKLNKVGEIK